MRKRHAALNATLQLEELQVHVDRVRQLRMLCAKGLELQRLARLRARRSWRPSGRIGHHAIIAGVRILMVGSEALPFAKTGGLADVLGALAQGADPSRARRRSRDAALPRHRCRSTRSTPNSRRAWRPGRRCADSRNRGRRRAHDLHRACGVLRSRVSSTARRSATIRTTRSASRSSVRRRSTGPSSTGHRYDVVHAHDWQAGLVPCCWTVRSTTQSAARTPTVFTIHNLAYQGDLRRELAAASRSRMGSDARWTRMEYWGRISYLKAGIVFSRHRDDRQSHLRAGDSDAGARLRLRRHPAGTSPAIWSGFSTESITISGIRRVI